MRVDQVQKIIAKYMQNSGRGGFITGTVKTVAPLVIQAGKLELQAGSLYITDSCIGLTLHLQHTHTCSCAECSGVSDALRDSVVLRPPLQAGDGVLLLCRPDNVDGVKYIILDRIQPYTEVREVTAR